MKLIKKNNISSIIADNEDDNYPALNMLNDSPKKAWVASNITPQDIVVNIAPRSSAIAIFAVKNIETITGVASSASSYSFYDGVTGYDGVELYESPTTTLPIDWDFMQSDAEWEDFISQDGFELTLSIVNTPGAYASIGIITAGESAKFDTINPSPGFARGLTDYSTVLNLANGGFYVKNRDVVENFSGQVVFGTTLFNEFKDVIKNDVKSSPTAWFIMTIGDDNEYLTYARLATQITGSMVSHRSVAANINLIEQV